MFETGTLIARANVIFKDIDCWVLQQSERKKEDLLLRLEALKNCIEEEKAKLYLSMNHTLIEVEKEIGYIPYPNLPDEDRIRSICILNSLLTLVELSKAAIKEELKAYKVVSLLDGDEDEYYTGYSLDEARKIARNDTYEIRIYTPWKPIELMDKDDLEDYFDEGGVFAEYKIYKEAKA